MAKMIPDIIASDTKSAAEKMLFSALQNLENTEDWTVIHSLRLAKHVSQTQGESDFVVIIPGKGLFVLEIKGGKKLSFSDGKWTSTAASGIVYEIKDPGKEANDGMHSIREYLKQNSQERDAARVLTGFGVVFPDTNVHGLLKCPDLADEQIADADDMLDLKAFFNRLFKFWEKRMDQAGVRYIVPDQRSCQSIVEILRPQIDTSLREGTVLRSLEDDLVKLTERQQMVFEGLTDNDRVLVSGSAGTGKTLLAINYAKEAAKQGKRVGFFCYNTKLADYLKERTTGAPLLTCDSFTEYMEKTAVSVYGERVTASASDDRNVYYGELLPKYFMEAVIETERQPFDCLVIDEAQDIMQEEYLEALDCILKGGLKEGNWYFFMDAEKQNLYHNSVTVEDVNRLLGKYGTYTRFSLRENCRNSLAIIKKISELFGTEVPGVYRKEDNGPEVRFITYEKNNEEAVMLENTIKELIDAGVRPGDITILSPVRFENSVACMIKDMPIVQAEAKKQSSVRFSTISAYKGLENVVILIADFDKIKSEHYKNLLYVGMTRARSELRVLVQKNVAEYLEKHQGEL